jgi:peptide/nickel transport system permease protein
MNLCALRASVVSYGKGMKMAVAELELEGLRTEKPESQFAIVWHRFRRHRLALAGMGVILFLILTAALAPLLAPYDPIAYQDLRNRNAGPSPAHWMGTDEIGRDVLSRLLYAGRISLTVAFVVVFLTETIGAFIGAVSGYYGGWVDALIQRITEFLITLPLLPLLLAFSAILRGVYIPGLPREWSSTVIIILVLTAFGWMGPCRLARGMVLSLREREFTEASRALGMSDLRIILYHMLPNALPPLIVDATLGLGGIVILESALSFLGFGVQPPVATWGNMLYEYQRDMWTQPLKVFFPGLAIFLAALSFNYIGDGLRDALDPRLKL